MQTKKKKLKARIYGATHIKFTMQRKKHLPNKTSNFKWMTPRPHCLNIDCDLKANYWSTITSGENLQNIYILDEFTGKFGKTEQFTGK
ncbi:hypothetical protein AQUCO_01100565v1 [Aquilegia coerulea]|uniref:Uncharacterized protein n=1 Tax=Aquilegia coerulea TaxID=218851 RepID=A0A2G5E7P4_AQUCA|nr:hypothetical protein AQUCO_01100565v1 [Aquilegia coerulea]